MVVELTGSVAVVWLAAAHRTLDACRKWATSFGVALGLRSAGSRLFPAIPIPPERAAGTETAGWVIHSFFVRAADDATGHDHTADGVGTEQLEDGRTDGIVGSDVGSRAEPAAENDRFVIRSLAEAEHDLRG